MSEVQTEEQQTTTDEATAQAEAKLTWKDRLAAITDGSRVADMAAVEQTITALQTLGAQALGVWSTLTGIVKGIAEQEANVRAYILTETGSPDWAGSTQAYKAVAEGTVDDVFGELPKNERKNLVSRIRQHVNRTYRDIAIVAYVAAMTTDTTGDPMFPGILDETGAANPEHAGYDVFKARVRRQYLDAGLTVPSPWRLPQDATGDGGGGNSNGGQDALSVLGRGLEIVAKGSVRDDYVAAHLLQGISAFVLEVANPQRDGGIKNRETVEEFLFRVSEIAAAGAKACASALTAKDREAMSPMLWNESEDKAKLSKDEQ